MLFLLWNLHYVYDISLVEIEVNGKKIFFVSGFHSKMEREVLDFLLRGKCGIVCVLARSIYKKIPDKFHEAYNAGRVLFIAPFETSTTRASRHLCQQRNEYIASISDELVFSSLIPDSSLLSNSEK